MTSQQIAGLALLCLSLAMSSPAHAQAGHNAHHGHGSPKLSLDHGQQWPTDAPLRNGMEQLRATFAAQVHAIHANKLSTAQYQALGMKVQGVVGVIVSECKLAPDADAQLHLIVAELLAGADAMAGKTEAAPKAGAHQLVMALNSYGKYFAHPGWKNIK